MILKPSKTDVDLTSKSLMFRGVIPKCDMLLVCCLVLVLYYQLINELVCNQCVSVAQLHNGRRCDGVG